MTNVELERIIDLLNEGTPSSIQLTQLTPHVSYGDVTREQPHMPLKFRYAQYDMFFVRNDEGVHVAAVLDMGHDLHVLVKPEHRKQGHLTKAMNDVILPYLRDHFDRDKQRVTFIDDAVGELIQHHWGFTITGNRDGQGHRIAEKNLSEYMVT
jgi:hypothetical protein